MGGIISGEHRVTKTRTNAQREMLRAAQLIELAQLSFELEKYNET